MKMKNSTFVITLTALILVAVVFIFWDTISAAFKKVASGISSTDVSGGTSGGTIGGGSTTVPAGLDGNKVLKSGSTGAEVSRLQELLNIAEKNNPLVIDGKFGPLTDAKLYRLTALHSITLNICYAKIKGFLLP